MAGEGAAARVADSEAREGSLGGQEATRGAMVLPREESRFGVVPLEGMEGEAPYTQDYDDWAMPGGEASQDYDAWAMPRGERPQLGAEGGLSRGEEVGRGEAGASGEGVQQRKEAYEERGAYAVAGAEPSRSRQKQHKWADQYEQGWEQQRQRQQQVKARVQAEAGTGRVAQRGDEHMYSGRGEGLPGDSGRGERTNAEYDVWAENLDRMLDEAMRSPQRSPPRSPQRSPPRSPQRSPREAQDMPREQPGELAAAPGLHNVGSGSPRLLHSPRGMFAHSPRGEQPPPHLAMAGASSMEMPALYPIAGGAHEGSALETTSGYPGGAEAAAMVAMDSLTHDASARPLSDRSPNMSPAASPRGNMETPKASLRHVPRSGKKRGVRFNNVEIRECRPLLGGGGGIPTQGSPLGMGWQVDRETRIDIDQFEEWRGDLGAEARRPREVFMEYGYVPPEEREERLLQAGHVKSELERSEFEIRIINRRRERSSYVPFGEEF